LIVSDNGWQKFLMRVVIGILGVAGLQLVSSSVRLQTWLLNTSLTQAAEQSNIPGELLVFADASLTEPFREIGKHLELAHPGIKVVFNFGGSSTLRMQLEQAAHADVFASADVIQMEQAKKSGVVRGDTPIFAKNRLVVIVPMANAAQIQTFCDL